MPSTPKPEMTPRQAALMGEGSMPSQRLPRTSMTGRAARLTVCIGRGDGISHEDRGVEVAAKLVGHRTGGVIGSEGEFQQAHVGAGTVLRLVHGPFGHDHEDPPHHNCGPDA